VTSPHRQLLAASLAFLATLPSAAAEPDCVDTRSSPCIDANALWPSITPSSFVGITSARRLAAGKVTTLGALHELSEPIALDVPSPDPFGRRAIAVDNRTELELGGAIGLGVGLDAFFGVPLVLHQSGSGLSSVTSSEERKLRSFALRDPRFGFGARIIETNLDEPSGTKLGIALHQTFRAPLGSENAFATEAGFVAAPGVVSEFHSGRFTASVDLGLRLRRPVRLGQIRLGTQAVVAAGVAAALDAESRYRLALEAFAHPVLVSQPSSDENGTVLDTRYVPAEWLASLQAAFDQRQTVRGVLGFGTALPLSRTSTTSPSGLSESTRYAGAPSVAVRLVFQLWVAFDTL
jgi:hypothetical protein